MTELRIVLNDSIGMDEYLFEEMIDQNSMFPGVYNSDILFASDFEDEDEETEEESEEEEEDLFDEDELTEEEGYEEDFDFDEEEDEEPEDEDVGTYN